MSRKAIATTMAVDESSVGDRGMAKRPMQALLLAALAALTLVAVLAAAGHGRPQHGPTSEFAGAKRGIASGTNEMLAGRKPGVGPGGGSIRLAGSKPGVSPGSGSGSVLLAGRKPGVSPGIEI